MSGGSDDTSSSSFDRLVGEIWHLENTSKVEIFNNFWSRDLPLRLDFAWKKKRQKMGVFYDFLVGWIAGKEQKKMKKAFSDFQALFSTVKPLP